MFRFHSIMLSAGLVLLAGIGRADVFMNEIMYQPAGIPEPTELEFIELVNSGSTAVDVSGWRFDKGVDFTFPDGTIMPPGTFLVVASDVAAFAAGNPSVSPVIGGWMGNLGNGGEQVRLIDAGGQTVDSVAYADEGDWAWRVREATFGGWAWVSPADGGGRSLELRNAAVDHDNGQNWGSSQVAGGTPGAVNSLASNATAPLISKVKHWPAVPTSAQQVTISCELDDESTAEQLTANLLWRDATAVAATSFQSVIMSPDGGKRFAAVLPPQASGTIIEFFVSASDGTKSRTWPAPTSEGQTANCQYQVDNEATISTDSYYRLILTAAENAAFESTPDSSNRQFNQTLIITRGGDATVRYQASMRIRGNSSRGYRFRPYRVSVPSDRPIDGVTGFNLNPRSPYLQFLTMRLFEAAGLRATDAIPVELRRNGVEETTATGSTPDYGKWVRVEDYNTDMVKKHWPTASSGNIYKKGRPDRYWRSAGWTVPSSADGVLDGWTKQNNGAANDWSDLTGFFGVVQTAAAPHFPGSPPGDVAESTGAQLRDTGNWNGTAFSGSELALLGTVADLDQWARWLAVMTIIQDNETNISNGQDDDYTIYFFPSSDGRRRAELLPHDLDTVFGLGDSPLDPDSRGLFDATSESFVFRPLLPLLGNATTPGNATFRAKYLQAIRQLYGSVFDADNSTNPYPAFYAFVDNQLGEWVPPAVRDTIKNFATARQAHLLSLIGAGPIAPPAPTSVGTLNSPHGDVMIHEVLADNLTTLNVAGTTPDVIELRNVSVFPFDLSGASISDDPAVPTKHVFPAGTVVPANGFLVLYGSVTGMPPQPNSLPFALGSGGEGVFLYRSPANGGTLIDSVVFGPQIANFSIGRTGANLDTWTLCAPTIGAANAAIDSFGSASFLRINECLGNTGYIVDGDFIELYNAASLPVPLGGISVTDDPINFPARQKFPALSYLGPKSFLRLDAKGSNATPLDAAELAFGIDGTFGSVAILGAFGTPIDQVPVVAQVPDVSRARIPDGGDNFGSLVLPGSMPTPGLPNAAPAEILALMNQLRITEIMYAPTSLEFIELQNVGSTPLDLSGVRFTRGISYVFAPGTTLGAGQMIVICEDHDAFVAQYGDLPNLAPDEFGGTLDNAGEILALQPPPPWGVNILKFEYRSDWYALTNANHSLSVVEPALTAPGDWGLKSSWAPSLQEFGTPGNPGPPVITSPLTVVGRLGDPFSYQIVAARNPTGYGSQSPPAGLLFDAATGVISGVPTEAGIFPVTITASSSFGADTETLNFIIEASGPMTGLAWEPIASPQKTDVPFAASLRAVDAQSRTVVSYQGAANLSAETTSSPIIVTELDTDTVDYFEIQNVSPTPVDLTGWFVAVNAPSNGPNAVSTPTGALPSMLAPGEVLYRTDRDTDGEDYYGVNIAWPSGSCWVMIVDNLGVIRDFVAVGYSAAEIAAMSIDVNGLTLTPGNNWLGDGVSFANNSSSQVLLRSGNLDHDDATDWSWQPTPAQFGTPNAGLTVPFANTSPLTVFPMAPLQFHNGTWSGEISLGPAASGVRLRAQDVAAHFGTSNPFDLELPPQPVITSPLSVPAVIGQTFSYQIGASNSPSSFGAAGLPDGLAIDDNTGLVTGVPTVAETSSITLFANGAGGTGSAMLTLDVQMDADGDGMGDAWEMAHGLSPENRDDGILDLDGDGQSNFAEWLARTGPDDSSSQFRIVSAGRVGANIQLAWQSVSGVRYRVMTRQSFASGNWMNLTPTPVVAFGSTTTYTHVGGATDTARYYRVEIVP